MNFAINIMINHNLYIEQSGKANLKIAFHGFSNYALKPAAAAAAVAQGGGGVVK